MNTTCIYCRDPLGDKPSTEHVLPRSLGTFDGNSPTLRRHVCRDCNNHFSGMERVVAKESWEALARVLSGAKPGSPRTKPHKNLSLRIQHGMLKGVEHSPIEGHDFIQVGIKRRDGQGHDFMSLDDFKRLEKIDKEVYSSGENAFLVVGHNEDGITDFEQAEVYREIARLGGKPTARRALQGLRIGDEIRIHMRVIVGSEAQRVYAKLAFNHLTYITSADFVLQECFDSVRTYIRTGTPPPFTPFATMRFREPDLDTKTAKASMSRHILAAGLTNLGSDISGFVLLYNTVYFKIKLCRFYPRWSHLPAIAKGTSHRFNITKRSVTRSGLPPEFYRLA